MIYLMEINNAWKTTCKLLLGDEIGDIDEYKDYLSKYVKKTRIAKSVLSGKDVILSDDNKYNEKCIISNNEREQYAEKTDMKIDLNQINDIDSITEALSEKVCYAGNIVLGNSKHVYSSNRCSNSSFVYKSQDISDGKYVGYTCMVRYGDHLFGSHSGGETKFGIKVFEMYKDVRCMETVRTYSSSDCFYTGNLEGCTNCMFSFNLRNKRNCIGNLELSSEKYSKIKSKLIEEIRETLRTKKKLKSIIDIVGGKNE